MNEVSITNPLVSIIVPVYNAENYVQRCLDSLRRQLYTNIEIIMIDDDSNDSTLTILKKNKSEDSRIILIHQKHSGPAHARMVGVENAKGDYIMFVDADDYIRNDTIAKLIEGFLESNADAIRFGGEYQNGKSVSPISKLTKRTAIYDHNGVMDLLLCTNKLNSLCLQIYKTKMLKDIERFKADLSYGEDFLINLEIHKKTSKLLLIDEPFYCYCDNPYSITRSREKEKILKNISDRVFASHEAIKTSNDYNERFREKVIYNQLKMVKNAILGANRIKKRSDTLFIKNLQDILSNNSFSEVDVDALNTYMSKLPLVERIKNKDVVLAILKADCNFILKYLKLYKKVERFIV